MIYISGGNDELKATIAEVLSAVPPWLSAASSARVSSTGEKGFSRSMRFGDHPDLSSQGPVSMT